MTEIKEHMEVIGADGVHVGTVDKVEGNRIKLTKADSGEGKHKGHHHFIDLSLVAEVDVLDNYLGGMPGVEFSPRCVRYAVSSYGQRNLGFHKSEAKVILDHME